MRTIHLLAFAACLAGTAAAQDALGGFDRPYTNSGNVFGKGAWGDGSGTAVPLPDPSPEYGLYYDQAYASGSATLFGTGFWSAEYMVRRAEGGVGKVTSKEWSYESTEAVWEGGPLGGGHAGGGKGGHGDKGHDKGHDKGDKDKCGCQGGHDKPHDKGGKHDKKWGKKYEKKVIYKYKEKTIYKEKTRYIPYARTQRVVVGRRSTAVVVIERARSTELGKLNVVTYQRRVQHLAAICIDGKGNEHPAIRVSTSDGRDDYDGEVFRCAGDRMLRVSFTTGTEDVAGAVRTSDGSSYKDCDGGDALIRTRGGELMCRAKRPMSAKAERTLEAQGGDYAEVAYEQTYATGGGLAPGEVDLSGLELTGGVGH
ncbi:MAG: hypothetical protein QM698_16445 [Micropepsaceae bacterium]